MADSNNTGTIAIIVAIIGAIATIAVAVINSNNPKKTNSDSQQMPYSKPVSTSVTDTANSTSSVSSLKPSDSSASQRYKLVYVWKDGSKYDGEWIDGKYDGYGVLRTEGYYQNNCPNCRTYKGYFKDYLKSGYGECYDDNGKLLYAGQFENDKPVGQYPQ